MKILSLINKILTNSVFRYLFTRYLTYFIQFVTSIFIAVKLGPYYFGIWGFILLLLNYFRIFDLGISSSVNILLVQNKDNLKKTSNYVTNALFLVGGLGVGIVLLALYYYFVGIPFFEKYEIDTLFYIVCLIAIIANFNVLLMNVYRVRNSLFHLSFYQSIIPMLVFLAIFITTEKKLLYLLLGAYLLGNIGSLILFVFGKKLPEIGEVNRSDSKMILHKGIYLFIYNVSFYLIILSIKTLVSVYYSVEEFGLFSFSFTLANSILLFLQALTFVIFPKVIDKLRNTNSQQVRETIDDIRESYVTMAFGLVFLALLLYPLFLSFLPKYQNAFVSLGLTSLTVVLYTNSFGYGTYLMAQNKEKRNAFISFLSLVLNLIIGFALIKIFKVEYNYVIIATVVAYSVYSYLCVHFGKKIMGLKDGFLSNLNDCFPFRLLLPYLVAFVLIILNRQNVLFIPLILYLILNRKPIKGILSKIKLLINKPDVINLK